MTLMINPGFAPPIPKLPVNATVPQPGSKSPFTKGKLSSPQVAAIKEKNTVPKSGPRLVKKKKKRIMLPKGARLPLGAPPPSGPPPVPGPGPGATPQMPQMPAGTPQDMATIKKGLW